MNKVDDIKPTIIGAGKNPGVFGSSTITYNEPGLTYNQAGQIYGGADLIISTGPTVVSFLNNSPTSSDVINLVPLTFVQPNYGVFGTSTNTYNQAGVTYNEAGQVYGGADLLAGIGPHMVTIKIGDSAIPVPGGNSGIPMGLLLALTYP